MRDRFPDAPWWVQSAVYVGIYAGFFSLIGIFGHWTPELDGRLIGGALGGGLVGAFQPRTRARLWEQVVPMPINGKAAVVRAAHRGPIPKDESLRTAALQFLHAELARQLVGAWLGIGFLGILTLGLLVDFASPVGLIPIAVVVALWASVARTRRRGLARARLLAGQAVPGSPAAAPLSS